MNSEDLLTIGQNARQETEHFLNRFIYDWTKRWPVISRFETNGKRHHLSSNGEKMEPKIDSGKKQMHALLKQK